jgi:hypothetical protein
MAAKRPAAPVVRKKRKIVPEIEAVLDKLRAAKLDHFNGDIHLSELCDRFSRNECDTLVRMLLHGWADAYGKDHYFKKGHKQEFIARRVLATLLRAFAIECNGPERQLQCHILDELADVFDPRPGRGFFSRRDIGFEFRREGHPGAETKRAFVAQHLRARVADGERIDSAVKSAEDTFDLSRSYVYDVWRRVKSDAL